MSPVYITNASTWDEADEHFDTFMAVVPQRRLELAERTVATDGPVLDHSVDSILAVTDWFITTALEAPEPGDLDYRPAWADPPNPDFVPGPGRSRPAPGWLFLLWEQVGVYVADVMLAQVPGSRWVCWRHPHPRGVENGMPTVDIGVPGGGFDAMSCANAGVLRTWSYRGSDQGGGWPDREQPLRHFKGTLADRSEYLRENAPRWQAAPTGPKARRSQAAPGG